MGEGETDLGETLTQQNLVPLLHKVPDGKGVLVHVAGREPLVRHVEDDGVLLALDQLRQLFPLLRCRVDARRVLGTRMQEDLSGSDLWGGRGWIHTTEPGSAFCS